MNTSQAAPQPTANPKPLSQARDADARHTVAALHRAAHNARQLAAATHTRLIVVSSSGASPVTSSQQATQQPGSPAPAQHQKP